MSADVYAIVIVFAAMMSGVGGGAFASSMANINPFYPRRRAGYALGMNGGRGNLGVSLCQLLLANVLMVYGASASAVGGLWVANGPWFLFPARAPLPLRWCCWVFPASVVALGVQGAASSPCLFRWLLRGASPFKLDHVDKRSKLRDKW